MHPMKLIAHAACALTLAVFVAGAAAQPVRPPYGPAINLEAAKKVAAGAAAVTVLGFFFPSMSLVVGASTILFLWIGGQQVYRLTEAST